MTDGIAGSHRSAAVPRITLVVLAQGEALAAEAPNAAPALTLAGQRWVVTEFADGASRPAYACVSYSWGRQRVRHPFAPEQLASARALPVVETAIRAWRPTAV